MDGLTVDLDTLAEVVGAYQAADTTVLDALNTELSLYTKNEDFINVVDVKIGNGATSEFRGVAIGSVANAAGNYAIALGFNSQAMTKSISIGTSSPAANNGVCIGHGSKSISNACLAIGYQAQAGFVGARIQSIAIGYNSIAEPQQSICIGLNSEILDFVTQTTVIGCNFKSAVNSDAFYVTPIRSDSTPLNILYYDNTTKEITFGVNTGSNIEETLATDLASNKMELCQ